MNRMTIAIVTPTFNCMRTIDEYMDAVYQQSFPHDCLEFIFADGGSTDGTLDRIDYYKKHGDIKISVYPNPLRTAEAGKAVGVKQASADFVLLLDSDNILPDENWMLRMTEPFENDKIVASEPIEYTYRKSDKVINRYCALIGMNDPLCLFTGNYDRYSRITGKWTEVEHDEIDCGNYLSIGFHEMIPTIGANGFMMRTSALRDNFDGDYLFDIDVLWELFQKDSALRVAKVKTGIVHLFCQDVRTFCRKQNRRIRDFLFFSDAQKRVYPWNSLPKGKVIWFIICCLTVLPLLVQSLIGFSRKKDVSAWLFHLVACWITLVIYGWATVLAGFGKKKAADRENWKQ